jgi:hypothetical protein
MTKRRALQNQLSQGQSYERLWKISHIPIAQNFSSIERGLAFVMGQVPT